MSQKMGFWSVVAIVIGSQIGSGIFLMPSSLAAFGGFGLLSWIITGTGAILLALIFAKLCQVLPKTGGPHAYVFKAFGKFWSFVIAWAYWLISWISSTAVIVAIIGYLTPVFNNDHPLLNFFIEVIILVVITLLNLRGVKFAGCAEFVFTVLKVLPLVLVPLAGLNLVNLEHFLPLNPTNSSTIVALNSAALITLWGFIGVESATTPAGSVEKPEKTIPKAIIVGTIGVALIYVFSSFVIMGIVPHDKLASCNAPYVEAANIIFGNGAWSIAVAFSAAIVCLGTLNAWILTSGQIALGAAQDKIFPKIFGKKNSNNAPVFSLVIATVGMVPLLALTMDKNLINQVNMIIDVSVTAFIIVYLICVLAFLKIMKDSNKLNFLNLMLGLMALIFCVWSLWASGFKTFLLCLSIFSTALPLYYFWHLKPKS
jgi:APA family basic amino acid/polyamine antiporter